MYSEWTPALLAEAMSELNDAQRRAIQCEVSSTTRTVGLITVRKFGFMTLKEYQEALNSATTIMREFFASLSIQSLTDLELPKVNLSHEGRILRSAR